MVRIDHEEMRLTNMIAQAERRLAEAKQDLFFYRNREVMLKKGLEVGHFPYDMTIRCLISDSPLEKCPFDNSDLDMGSPIFGGSDTPDSALYYCPSCETNFYQPLTKADQEKADKKRTETLYADSVS